MKDNRWGVSNTFSDTFIHSPGSEGVFQVSPYKVLRPDLKGEEALFALRSPEEEWRFYMEMQTPQFDLRWAGITTGFGPVMVMIFDLWDAANPSQADTSEVFPDPVNLAFRDLYLEMSTYSHIHMAVLDGDSKVCRWIEMPNHFRLDKFVQQCDTFAEDYVMWRHKAAKAEFFEVQDPSPLHQAMREHYDKETLLAVRVKDGQFR